MELLLKNIFSFLFVIFLFSCTNNKRTGVSNENFSSDYVKSELNHALIKNEVIPDKVISDSETAVKVAEVFLFKIYGEQNIIKQKSYAVNYINEYYVINGTLPKQMKGGTFLIIINSKDGKVIKLTHGK